MNRLILGAFMALGALGALPALASATPAHLSPAPEVFTLTGGASEWSRVAGGATTATSTTGSGSFENTTTGSLTLTFHHKTAQNLFTCTSAGNPAGTITTTPLTFHLVMIGTQSYFLITPGSTPGGQPKDHFATYNCGIFVGTIVVKGNGMLGQLTSPECGKKTTSATVRFTGASGVQSPQAYTGTNYTLESSIAGGAYSPIAINAEATLSFGGSERELICT